MKCLLWLAALIFFMSYPTHAEDITPAMEQAFLSQLKTAVAHKDYKLFRELFYESQNNGRWLDLQNIGPFDTIFSTSSRTYHFQSPNPMTGIGGHPITPTVSPVFYDQKWHEDLVVIRELIITFPTRVPGTSGNIACIPLILKNEKLLAVDETYFSL